MTLVQFSAISAALKLQHGLLRGNAILDKKRSGAHGVGKTKRPVWAVKAISVEPKEDLVLAIPEDVQLVAYSSTFTDQEKTLLEQVYSSCQNARSETLPLISKPME